MQPEKDLNEDSEDEFEDYKEEANVNSMIPIWKKNKSELTPEDYEKFYAEKRYGYDKPIKHIHIKCRRYCELSCDLVYPGEHPVRLLFKGI